LSRPDGGDNQADTYQAAPNVVARLVGDETVIVNLETEQYYSLNCTGALVWSHLLEGDEADRVSAQLADEYDISRERAAADVQELTAALLANGLLHPAA